jgi:NADH-quinone oxidoreductase subunit C
MSFEKLKSSLATLAEQGIDSLLIADTDHAVTGTDLELTVLPESVPAAGLMLDQANYTLEAISGIDWLTQGRIEIVYDYSCFESGIRVTVRTFVGREQPQLPTLSGVYPGADWHERETHDFFGVIFSGHPDLTPLLLPEDAHFHPLRKDFTG